MARLLPLQLGVQTPRQKDREAKHDDETPAAPDCLGIATPELKAFLQMCGKPAVDTFDFLPAWFQQCGGKGLLDQYNMTIVQKQIMTATYYDDAEIPLLAPLLKIYIKRN